MPTLAKHFQVTFQIVSNVFFGFFFLGFCVFFTIFFLFGKVSCSPTEAMATEGDTFFLSNCFSLFCGSFICYLFARARVCVCVFFSFSMIINMETNKASQAK